MAKGPRIVISRLSNLSPKFNSTGRQETELPRRFHMIAVLSMLLTLAALPVAAQERGADRADEQRRKADELRDYIRAHYTKSEYMAPMRDGTRLFLSIYAPKDSSQKYPVWMMRTP